MVYKAQIQLFFFLTDPKTTLTTQTTYLLPCNLPQVTNFAKFWSNLDEIWCCRKEWRANLKSIFIFLIWSPQPPYSPNLPQDHNFSIFGPIWMRFGVEVKNGEHSSNVEWFFIWCIWCRTASNVGLRIDTKTLKYTLKNIKNYNKT